MCLFITQNKYFCYSLCNTSWISQKLTSSCNMIHHQREELQKPRTVSGSFLPQSLNFQVLSLIIFPFKTLLLEFRKPPLYSHISQRILLFNSKGRYFISIIDFGAFLSSNIKWVSSLMAIIQKFELRTRQNYLMLMIVVLIEVVTISVICFSFTLGQIIFFCKSEIVNNFCFLKYFVSSSYSTLPHILKAAIDNA